MSARITRRMRIGLVLGAVLALVLLPAAYAERLRAGADAPTASVRNFPGPAPCNTTLPACVSGSNAGDVISITNGLLIEGLVVITHALTLQGHGPTITVVAANSAHGVISIGVNIASGVVITGLGVLGGSNVPSGAGIFASSGSPLTLVNVDVVSNTSTSSGGGVFASDALTMSNVSLSGNQAPNGAGGGLRAASSVVIEGGSFERNTSLNPGGAMRVSGPLTLTNVTVISNSISGAGTDGGGIRADGGLFMLGGLVQNNQAVDRGGGVFASSASISGTSFISNAGNDGGGVFALGTLALSNVVLDHGSSSRPRTTITSAPAHLPSIAAPTPG